MILYTFNLKENANFYGRDPYLATLDADCDPNGHAERGAVRAATQTVQNG
jgi:hypothetical protein